MDNQHLHIMLRSNGNNIKKSQKTTTHLRKDTHDYVKLPSLLLHKQKLKLFFISWSENTSTIVG